MEPNRELIKKYSDEMMEMYRRTRPVQTSFQETYETAADEDFPTANEPSPESLSSEGAITVRVTTLKGLYPVEGARVTVFSGEGDSRTEYSSVLTDQSGRTVTVSLKTPAKQLSESAGATTLPYSLYNLSVTADGYLENIHLNIPVFPDTVSVQTSDMVSLAAAGPDTNPRILDESQKYEL